MAVGTEWCGHRAERVTEGDGAKGKEAGSGSGSVEGSTGGGWVREGQAVQVRRECAGQTDGVQTAQMAHRWQANLWADSGARAGNGVQCHVLAGALSKFKVIWHFKSLDHTLMERSLFCTVVHLYSWCNG